MTMSGSNVKRIGLVVSIILACLPNAHSIADKVTWVSSTENAPWQLMEPPTFKSHDQSVAPQVGIFKDKIHQTIDGFGGCFNELGWDALQSLSDADREKALVALFGSDGCSFNQARIPVGASDFALDAYSLDDTPGDLALDHFTIERDKKFLIPYIKGALQVRSDLKCWASPWSPPAWMKTNNNYSKGSIRFEPSILSCYAEYLVKWVRAYREIGINVYAIAPQNEPNILSAYPSCLWTGIELRDFIADYLGPALRKEKVPTELWLGTMNGDPPNGGDNFNYRIATVMEDAKASAFISAITFQYDSKNLIGETHETYPDTKLIQSETECYSGKNSWSDAQRLFVRMKHYFDNGASSYFAWNMILDETGMSTWKWKQNALITVDRPNAKLKFNGEYYVMRHFSQFVKPGARRVQTTGPWGDKIAFVNLDGSIVAVLGNSNKNPLTMTMKVADSSNLLTVTLPAQSINTFLIESVKDRISP